MKVLSVISGKGGVGNTTVAINLAAALTEYKRNVILVDGNLENPHLGLNLGSGIFKITLNNVLKGENDVLESIYSHHSGLSIIPASIAKGAYTNPKNINNVLKRLEDKTELLIVDGFLNKDLIKISDGILLVTSPDILSITSALRTIKSIEELHGKIIGIVVNKKTNKEYDMTNDNIEKMLEIPIILTISEDNLIKEALYRKMPLVKLYPGSDFTKGFMDLAKTMV